MEIHVPDAMPGWWLPAFTTPVTVTAGAAGATVSVTGIDSGLLDALAAVI